MPIPMALILHERRKDVGRIEYVSPCPADWVPAQSCCHQNAAAWVERFPSWEVVRGWLLIADDDVLGTIFDAHSVVRDLRGDLWDVTQKDSTSIAVVGSSRQPSRAASAELQRQFPSWIR